MTVYIGWGRRSKKRPQRKSPSGGRDPVADTTAAESGPASQSATESFGAQTTTTTTDTSNSYILSSHADGDSCQPNNDIRYQPRNSRSLPEHPRTLVNGVYYAHDPNSLPEPLGQGYMAWAMLEREAASQSSPRHPGESRWNNRTLRFWHLSTDFNRFRSKNDEDDLSQSCTRDGEQRHNAGDGTGSNRRRPSSTPALNKDLTLQRPYTAPPHQL
ncbi:uncharacterized protein LAJ45_01627 [Morchella importuna]|uniref:uncharacterized protein n=1 Tax=Morchella importuna TaxID=1174673 RepID=UPI001E8DFAA5|nr:uncharacterized protein LAJ45_01627 [Morchella importuna]KAH8153860.1 hypothetical protein LAJ45_01627 [Morchella importuna]